MVQAYFNYLTYYFPETALTYCGYWVVQKGERGCSRVQHYMGDKVLSTLGLGLPTDAEYEQIILDRARIWFGGNIPPYKIIRVNDTNQ